MIGWSVRVVALGFLLMPTVLFLYAYAIYPMALLLVCALRKSKELPKNDPPDWPKLSICMPVHNEEGVIRDSIESLLELDYPPSRRQLLVVSDASTDGTDAIVTAFSDRGVQFVRLENRGGKTAAENTALEHLTGDIVVNIDATTRLPRSSLKRLVRVFQDERIGVASGRDISMALGSSDQNRGESPYVDYEMWIRGLETRIDSIVGASGCFYAIRRQLHARSVAPSSSRDFSAALAAKTSGFRAVSVMDAICYVPRTTSLRVEFRRKARTMARGLDTLWLYRRLTNLRRHGLYSWMLVSHKLARWLVPLLAPLFLIGLLMLSLSTPVARVFLAVSSLAAAAALVALYWPQHRQLAWPVSVLGYAVGSLVAGFVAWIKFAKRQREAIWEPTRRVASPESETGGGISSADHA